MTDNENNHLLGAEKLSVAETVKLNSHYLRGTIAKELTEPADKFNKDDAALLKFHGTYQQDDREHRVKQEGGKSLRQYIFMVRSAIPGGKLTSEQLLGELAMCDELGNGTLRITSRQGLQLHGVPKHNLQETIRRINEIKLSTLAACGDVKRNVMCCPAPHHNDPVHAEMQSLADKLAADFTPHTRAYHEIWLGSGDRRRTIFGRRWFEWGMRPTVRRLRLVTTVLEPIYGPHRFCRENLNLRLGCRATIASICTPTTLA